jgi:8-oxo-dGTP pyrophosphatase MutT (NUDIX family)
MQGGWENDETVEEAAAREAIEEAGVRGDLVVRHCFYVLFDTTLVPLSPPKKREKEKVWGGWWGVSESFHPLQVAYVFIDIWPIAFLWKNTCNRNFVEDQIHCLSFENYLVWNPSNSLESRT